MASAETAETEAKQKVFVFEVDDTGCTCDKPKNTGAQIMAIAASALWKSSSAGWASSHVCPRRRPVTAVMELRGRRRGGRAIGPDPL
jgi:hypothetical protein